MVLERGRLTKYVGDMSVFTAYSINITHPYILYNQRIKYLASIQRGMLPTLQWLFFSLTPSDIDGFCPIWKSHDGTE